MARLALDETVAFDEAVERVLNMTSAEDTLVIVTADHAHPFYMASWASLNNNILGLDNNVIIIVSQIFFVFFIKYC